MATLKLLSILVVAITMASLLIYRVMNGLSTGQDIAIVMNQNKQNEQGGDQLVIGDSLEHIMWFMQITDIHICVLSDKNRTRDLELFCNEYLDIIEPSVVLATGDLTNSDTREPMGTNPEEWLSYSTVLKKCNVSQKTDWLDIRGNHDNKNVFGWYSPNNYFREFSMRGPHNNGSYRHRISKGSDSYSFIGVDASFHPNLKGLNTFHGHITAEGLQQLKTLSSEERDTNYTIWFGHYPTSALISPFPGIRNIIDGPYLCGHFHSIWGLVPQMYSTQSTGYLEAELSDWKDTRSLRLAAVDYGMFTFVDFHLHEWPIILITNPKNSLYSLPNIEPYYRVSNSTHIRALVFSKARLVSVKTKLNDNKWTDMRHISGPLYVLEWNPSDYGRGLHSIEVTAEDSADNERTVGHKFSVDGTKQEFPLLARIMLRSDTRLLAQLAFFTIVTLCVLPLIFLRISGIPQQAENSIMGLFVYKLYLLVREDRMFYPLVIVPVYASTGPWFIARMVGDHIGVCFVWGILVADSFIPGGFTYVHGGILLSLQIPITWSLSELFYYSRLQSRTFGLSIKYYLAHLVILLSIIAQIFISRKFYYTYGLMALFLGFFNTWSSMIYTMLWLTASKANPTHSAARNKVKHN